MTSLDNDNGDNSNVRLAIQQSLPSTTPAFNAQNDPLNGVAIHASSIAPVMQFNSSSTGASAISPFALPGSCLSSTKALSSKKKSGKKHRKSSMAKKSFKRLSKKAKKTKK